MLFFLTVIYVFFLTAIFFFCLFFFFFLYSFLFLSLFFFSALRVCLWDRWNCLNSQSDSSLFLRRKRWVKRSRHCPSPLIAMQAGVSISYSTEQIWQSSVQLTSSVNLMMRMITLKPTLQTSQLFSLVSQLVVGFIFYFLFLFYFILFYFIFFFFIFLFIYFFFFYLCVITLTFGCLAPWFLSFS